MTAPANRQPARKPANGPVQEFLWSLDVMQHSAAKVKKLPRRVFLEQLAAADSPMTEVSDLARQIATLGRQFEEIRGTLQEREANRKADSATRKSSRYLKTLIEAQTLMNPAEFAARMCWTRQALSKALKSGRVFFVEFQGSRYYPAFFAESRYDRRHLEAVSKLLGDLPGATKLQFMSTPKGSLGGLTPLEALAKGHFAATKVAAEGFAQR